MKRIVLNLREQDAIKLKALIEVALEKNMIMSEIVLFLKLKKRLEKMLNG